MCAGIGFGGNEKHDDGVKIIGAKTGVPSEGGGKERTGKGCRVPAARPSRAASVVSSSSF